MIKKDEIQGIFFDAMKAFEKTGVTADAISIHPETRKMPIWEQIQIFARENGFIVLDRTDMQIGIVIFSNRLNDFNNQPPDAEFISFAELFERERQTAGKAREPFTVGHLRELMNVTPLPDHIEIVFQLDDMIIEIDNWDFQTRFRKVSFESEAEAFTEFAKVKVFFKKTEKAKYDVKEVKIKYSLLRAGDAPLEFENYTDAWKYLNNPRSLKLPNDHILAEAEIRLASSFNDQSWQTVGNEYEITKFGEYGHNDIIAELVNAAYENLEIEEKELAKNGRK